MENTMSKEELVDFAVKAIMDDEECRISRLECNIAEKSEGEHKKAVERLAELVFSEYPNRSLVDKAVGNIDDGLTAIFADVGDELYIQGFIDAAGLLGVKITQKDIEEGRDRENMSRDRSNAKWFLEKEAERISKMFGVSVSISVEG